MKSYRSRYELKRDVKDLIYRNRKKVTLLFMIPMFTIIFAQYSGKHTSVLPYSTADQLYAVKNLIETSLFGVIFGLLFLIIIQSANFKGLDLLRNPDEDFEPLKSNFTYFRNPDWWKLILTYILINIFTFLWTLLLVIPGIIKTFSYSQTYYVYKDMNDKGLGDDKSLTDYITISRKLMDGNKWRYFVLQLSFIGWWLLSGIIAAVGFLFGPLSGFVSTLLLALYMLWFYPYYVMTLANFYKDLVDQNPELLK
ncbi:DUF975 family protein [Companilactobacillus insicii]|uniref:DUF975 family protein n=1 Tax=Companilactobacillus insicii TaxID=1732567 RepID=UPI000F7A8AD0|nr:DUF975 family protein [Companilactobacillus insicii]